MTQGNRFDEAELDSLIEDIHKTHRTRNWRGNRIAQAGKIPFGYPALDRLMQGGIPRSHLTLLTGRPSCGKSFLCLTLAREVQQHGGIVCRVDAELYWESDWVEANGVNPDRVFLSRPISGEEAFTDISIWLNGFQKPKSKDKDDRIYPDLIVIDSLAALVAGESMKAEKMDNSPMAPSARFLSGYLPRIYTKIQNNTALVAINQTRTSMGANGTGYDAPSGGSAQLFFANLILEVRKGNWLPDEKSKMHERTGFVMGIRIKKTKVGGLVDDEASVPFSYNAGVLEQEAYMDEAIYRGIVERAGSYYKYGGLSIQGRAKFQPAVVENEELYAQLKKEVDDSTNEFREHLKGLHEYNNSEDVEEEVEELI